MRAFTNSEFMEGQLNAIYGRSSNKRPGAYLQKEYFSKKISSINGDMKETWRVINQVINSCSETTNIDLLNVDDQLITDKFDISNAMNDYFCSAGNNLNKAIPFKPNPLLTRIYPVNSSKPIFKFKAINTRQIEQVVSKTKTSLGSAQVVVMMRSPATC